MSESNPPLFTTSNRFFSIRPPRAFLYYLLLDILALGMGMGVPIFCILLGCVVGWYSAGSLATQHENVAKLLKKVLHYARITTGVTFLGMILIWGRSIRLLFDPHADLANFGMPLILYEPKASFIGWLVLMIGISPFLQLIMTIFGAYLTLMYYLRREEMSEQVRRGKEKGERGK
ncbi:hypothetical protein L0128_16645 [candidate division KSB1 bacterium]|nr:hypothetical protein [candidate division KSB1 bacterium]